MRQEAYLDFTGWIRLNAKTQMQYVGDDDNREAVIPVTEWIKLPKHERQLYIVEDVIAAIRDSEDLEYDSLNLTINEYSDDE